MVQKGFEPDATVRISDADMGVTLAVGQRVFGRYVLERVIGRGGMGEVWCASDETLHEKIALKFLPAAVARNASAVDELKVETLRARRLTHSNIVRIHQFEQDETMVAVSMELVEGTTLDELRLKQPGKVFSIENLGPLVQQIGNALDYAHCEAEVVHRDLKPANILVAPNGTAKIVDFGIARSLSESQNKLTTVTGGGIKGTVYYMSPQQLSGGKPSAADDVYSLGAMIYELLTTKTPYFREEFASLIVMAREGKLKSPLPMEQLRSELGVTGAAIPSVWEETVQACLAKQAKDRPASALDVLAKLGLGSAPARAPATSAAAVATSADETVVIAPPAEAPQPARPRTSRRGIGMALAAGIAVAAVAVLIFWRRGGEKTPDAAASVTPASTPAAVAQDTTDPASTSQEPKKSALETGVPGAGVAPTPAPIPPPVERGALALHLTNTGIDRALVEVTIDGNRHTPDDTGTLAGIEVGTYTVVVAHPDYEPWRGTGKVVNHETTALDVTLKPKPGHVTIHSVPADLALTVNGQEAGSDRFSNGVLTLTAGENYTVVARAKTGDYRTATKTFMLLTNGRDVWDVELEAIPYIVNSLGMKFMAVPGTGVAVSIWNTRVGDFAAYVSETRVDATKDVYTRDAAGNYGNKHGGSWRSPGFTQTDTDPVVGVSWDDARKFCDWLTKKERAAGHLKPNQIYRLPTDAEWSVAVGLNEPKGGSPKTKDKQIKGIYPWGTQFPPPHGAGNYADDSARKGHPKGRFFDGFIDGYDDGYADTSPAGSFGENKFGLFDMGGNVWQWCEDAIGNDGQRVQRGGSFGEFESAKLLSSARTFAPRDHRSDRTGFRCVIADTTH